MHAFWTKSFFPKRHEAVTPSDTVDLRGREPWVVCSLEAGTLAVHDCFGNAITYPVAAGDIIPVLVKRVLVTGTDVDCVALQ